VGCEFVFIPLSRSIVRAASSISALTMLALVLGQVDGMDCLAVKQAVKFAKEYALKNGPMVIFSFDSVNQYVWCNFDLLRILPHVLIVLRVFGSCVGRM
jgi:hypothetical protein